MYVESDIGRVNLQKRVWEVSEKDQLGHVQLEWSASEMSATLLFLTLSTRVSLSYTGLEWVRLPLMTQVLLNKQIHWTRYC